VDFTADCGLTCQVNKKTSIEIPSVARKAQGKQCRGPARDYTHFPENISAELNRFNRAGVPLVFGLSEKSRPHHRWSCRRF